MMMNNIVLSERQRPRALKFMKAIYASHPNDPNCEFARTGQSESCPMMVELKQRIDELEQLEQEALHVGGSFSRSLALE
jgi:hypothetical protein